MCPFIPPASGAGYTGTGKQIGVGWAGLGWDPAEDRAVPAWSCVASLGMDPQKPP